jgi:hypothetical protein
MTSYASGQGLRTTKSRVLRDTVWPLRLRAVANCAANIVWNDKRRKVAQQIRTTVPLLIKAQRSSPAEAPGIEVARDVRFSQPGAASSVLFCSMHVHPMRIRPSSSRLEYR